MGVVATNAIQARQQSRVVRINRIVATRDAKDPELIARNHRIKAAVRAARRALRARAAAELAADAAEANAGVAARRLVAEGISRSDAAILLDLSRSSVKGLLRLAGEATDVAGAESSTEPTVASPSPGTGVHGEHSRAAIRGATNEGNR